MGGHASPGAGGLVDGSPGSHEGRLERAHDAGEEGWYVNNEASFYLRRGIPG